VFKILKHAGYRHMKKLSWTNVLRKAVLENHSLWVSRLPCTPALTVCSPECFVYFSNVTLILQQNKKKEQTCLGRKRGHRIEDKEKHWKFVPPAACLTLPIFVFYLKGRAFVSLLRW
jgi:hypothetical protein